MPLGYLETLCALFALDVIGWVLRGGEPRDESERPFLKFLFTGLLIFPIAALAVWAAQLVIFT